VIQDKTTLILGAGASCHYGFPTGEELIKQVCERVDKFHDEAKEKFLKKIKLLDPINIDLFLRDNPSLQGFGTFLIADVLLACEANCKSVPENDHNSDEKTSLNNWYRFLIHVLAACDSFYNLKKVFLDEQKLSIITFNYDVSLEYHLYNSLKKIEKFQDSARDFMRAFSKNCIFHVYGALRQIDWNVDDPFADFGQPAEEELEGLEGFMKKVELSLKCCRNIQTIYGSKANQNSEYKEKMIQAIDDAKRLFILGYGFDDANTQHLSENYSRGLAKALSSSGSQRIFMTNYGDSKRIENKLNLKEREDYHFISDKNVYNALMYDFDLVS
jgi:hypothetical protein